MQLAGKTEDEKLELFLTLSEELGIQIPTGTTDALLTAKVKKKAKSLNISFEEARRRAFALWLKT